MGGDAMMMYQCNFARGSERTTGWIEARGATYGASVELLDLDRPHEPWTVTKVYSIGMEKDALQAKQGNDRKGFASIGKVKR